MWVGLVDRLAAGGDEQMLRGGTQIGQTRPSEGLHVFPGPVLTALQNPGLGNIVPIPSSWVPPTPRRYLRTRHRDDSPTTSPSTAHMTATRQRPLRPLSSATDLTDYTDITHSTIEPDVGGNMERAVSPQRDSATCSRASS